MRRHPRQHRAQQRKEFFSHALAGLQYLFGGDLLPGHAGGHVGDARNCEDFQTQVAGGNDLRHGGHAHEVCADGTQEANLGRQGVSLGIMS